ncbi:hypothetical protein JCM10213_001359 [Rhodosporidiobolus nylandii]
MRTTFAALAFAAAALPTAFAGATVNPSSLPHQSESGQYGYNDCTNYGASPNANCQTAHINSLDDFCLFAPPQPGVTVGDSERYEVAWCTRTDRAARLIPKGAIKSAHLIRTPHYIQITGTGDFTKMNIQAGDAGGELDPHGADGLGNPIGGVVLSEYPGQLTQIKEWHQFISSDEFCIRACLPGPDAARWCQHIYDVMGCYWNDPGNYDGGFDECKADDTVSPPGVYKVVNGGKTSTSTWYQGVNPTPAAHAPAASSQCKAKASLTLGSYTTGRITTSTRPASTSTTTQAPAQPTAGTCKVTADCSNSPPANANKYCNNGTCSFRCRSGFKQSGNTCVKA